MKFNMDDTVYLMQNYERIMGWVMSGLLEVEGKFLVLDPQASPVWWFTILMIFEFSLSFLSYHLNLYPKTMLSFHPSKGPSEGQVVPKWPGKGFYEGLTGNWNPLFIFIFDKLKIRKRAAILKKSYSTSKIDRPGEEPLCLIYFVMFILDGQGQRRRETRNS